MFVVSNFSSASNNRPNKLSVMHLNARSIKANLSKIKDAIRNMEYKFHIIAISETWLNENNWKVTCNEVAFSGYKLYCNSRKSMQGGGVAIYVCESLLNNCQSSDICLRNISYVADNCFKAYLSSYRLVNTKKSMSVVCIER